MRRNIPVAMAETTRPTRRNAVPTVALATAGAVALVAITVAISRGGDGNSPAQPPTNVAAASASAATAPDPGRAALQRVDELRAQLARDPDDAALWFELGGNYRGLGAAAEAQQAFRRATELQPRNAEYVTYLGEAVLMNGVDANGLAEAERLFNRALAIEPRNPMTRFYAATMKDQRGRHQEAVDDLLVLLREAPPGAPWATTVRNSIENIARLRHIDVAGRLPPPAPGSNATAAIPGPTRDQMDAARGIPPSQQDEMVAGMVGRLAARLQQNPRDEEGWARLMRSYKVLDRSADASAALRSALGAFADDPAAQQRLRAAAGALRVPER